MNELLNLDFYLQSIEKDIFIRYVLFLIDVCLNFCKNKIEDQKIGNKNWKIFKEFKIEIKRENKI